MALRKQNPAAVTLGRRGGNIGGPARAAKLTPEQRSESARKAVQARWAEGREGSDSKVLKRKKTDIKPFDTSREALHLCLDRIKMAKNKDELYRLTQELQKIVFYRSHRCT
jgi:hypothetical protein